MGHEQETLKNEEAAANTADSQSSTTEAMVDVSKKAMPPPNLSTMPSHVKWNIMRHLSIPDLAIVEQVSKDMRDHAQACQLWRPRLIRDFGQTALDDFEKQRFLKQGFSTEKDYYKHLFNNFHKQVAQLLLFLDEYTSKYKSHHYDSDSREYIVGNINLAKKSLLPWQSQSKKKQFAKIKFFQTSYINIINFLAKYKISHGTDGSPLAYAIIHHDNFDTVALSLIKSPMIDINFSTESAFTPLESATETGHPSITRALLEHPKIIINPQSVYILSPKSSVEAMLYYHVLKKSATKIPAIEREIQTEPNNVLDYIFSLVDETIDLQAQLDILESAIAIADGQYASGLSAYLHGRGKRHGLVKRIQDRIATIKAQQAIEAKQAAEAQKTDEHTGNDLGSNAASTVDSNNNRTITTTTTHTYPLDSEYHSDKSEFLDDQTSTESTSSTGSTAGSSDAGITTVTTVPKNLLYSKHHVNDDTDDIPETIFHMSVYQERQPHGSLSPGVITRTPVAVTNTLKAVGTASKYTLAVGLCASALTGVLWLAGVARIGAPVWVGIGITLGCIAAVYLIVHAIELYFKPAATNSPFLLSSTHGSRSLTQTPVFRPCELNAQNNLTDGLQPGNQAPSATQGEGSDVEGQLDVHHRQNSQYV